MPGRRSHGRHLAALLAAAVVVVIGGAGTGVLPASAAATAPPTSAYASAVLADHPLSYWRLDETAGVSELADEAGGHPAATQGTLRFQQGSPVAGGSSIGFGGGAAATRTNTAPVLQPSTWTVETWFQARLGAVNDYVMLMRSRAYGFGLNLQLSPTASDAGHVGLWEYDSSSAATAVASSGGGYADGRWHHVAVTRGASTLTLYVDGTSVASAPTSSAGTYYCCDDQLVIGADTLGGSAAFPGNLAEVAYYGAALTPDRIAAHIRAAAGVSCGSNASLASSPIAGGSTHLLQLSGTAQTAPTGSVDVADIAGVGGAAPDQYGVQIAWGDGATSAASASALSSALTVGGAQFGCGVVASHAYALGIHHATVTVTASGGLTATSGVDFVVAPSAATAAPAQVGVLTSSDGPQCGATLIDAAATQIAGRRSPAKASHDRPVAKDVVITAAACLSAPHHEDRDEHAREYLFAPGYSGTPARISADYATLRRSSTGGSDDVLAGAAVASPEHGLWVLRPVATSHGLALLRAVGRMCGAGSGSLTRCTTAYHDGDLSAAVGGGLAVRADDRAPTHPLGLAEDSSWMTGAGSSRPYATSQPAPHACAPQRLESSNRLRLPDGTRVSGVTASPCDLGDTGRGGPLVAQDGAVVGVQVATAATSSCCGDVYETPTRDDVTSLAGRLHPGDDGGDIGR